MKYSEPVLLDNTGKDIVDALNNIANKVHSGEGDYYWLLRYFNNGGTVLLSSEYVQNGEDGTRISADWTPTINGKTPVPDCILDILSNTDVYSVGNSYINLNVDALYKDIRAGYPPTTRTYTSNYDGLVLALQMVVCPGQRGADDAGINITSDGTILDSEKQYYSGESLIYGCYCAKIIQLNSGDTITFIGGNGNSPYSERIVSMVIPFNIEMGISNIVVRGNYGTTGITNNLYSYTADANKHILAICCQVCTDENADASAIIKLNDAEINNSRLYNMTSGNTNYVAVDVADFEVEIGDIVTLKGGTPNVTVGQVYIVIEYEDLV